MYEMRDIAHVVADLSNATGEAGTMTVTGTPDMTGTTGAMRTPVVGRFAPTPSGRMHLGNIYAMLAAWLSARAAGGRIVLRIEDIDQPRVLPDADRWIMDDLTWLGLTWDGEPVYQSQRLDRYVDAIRTLSTLDTSSVLSTSGSSMTSSSSTSSATVTADHLTFHTNAIYPCFCSRSDIRAASAPQEGDGFVVYPGTCRRLLQHNPDEIRARLDRGDQHSLRLFAPDRNVRFTDRVFGLQTFNLAHDLGDTVIRRADGIVSYQLAVTVDDLDMGVTDVVRGRDLLRSTALQLYIREQLIAGGWLADNSRDDRDGCARDRDRSERSGSTVASTSVDEVSDTSAEISTATPDGVPSFAHLPLIDNAAGRRLAKRQRSLDMGVLRARGVSAQRVIGYCAWLLGLLAQPEPCAARDLIDHFSWERLAANRSDRRVPDDPFADCVGLDDAGTH